MNRSGIIFAIAAVALFASCLLDLVLCPHSKVEESFALQATHDLYYHGVGPAIQRALNASASPQASLPYDHLQYPGVVPRTFLGPVLLACLCRAILWPCLALDLTVSPMMVQFLARFFLLLLNIAGWIRLARSVDRRSSLSSISRQSICWTNGSWLLTITACQFHIPYYASRMLPNTFALAIVLQCYACWIDGQIQTAAALLVLATAVFRCDLLLLLGSIGVSWLITRQLTIIGALKIGVVTGVVALSLTVPLDSLLWQRWLWPEGEVFYFNTFLGKSKEWGTSPWHWYFSSALPKAMLFTVLFLPISVFRIIERLVLWELDVRQQSRYKSGLKVGVKNDMSPLSLSGTSDGTWLQYYLPILGFIGLYSLLGHKEMRFIFPALPILNLVAAAGMSKLSYLAFSQHNEKKDDDLEIVIVSWVARFGFACGLLCLTLTLCGSLAFVAVSRLNYPGGIALLELTSYVQEQIPPRKVQQVVSVHIDVASAMSGVSLFGQRAAEEATPTIHWTFVKDGYEENRYVGSEGWDTFTHLLSEDPKAMEPRGFDVIRTIPGKPRFSLRERGIVSEDAIYILEKTEWMN